MQQSVTAVVRGGKYDKRSTGFLTGLDDKELRPVGFIVNCPVVYRVN
jgi:hypothetical protein